MDFFGFLSAVCVADCRTRLRDRRSQFLQRRSGIFCRCPVFGEFCGSSQLSVCGHLPGHQTACFQNVKCVAAFRAVPQINVASNPRRWIVNFGQIDVSNDKGEADFRDALLKLADNSVQVLKDIGAQGMITRDPEGEEFPGSCYYGDPRLVPTLAPEMEFKSEEGKSVIDEYFEKFRAAGLK